MKTNAKTTASPCWVSNPVIKMRLILTLGIVLFCLPLIAQDDLLLLVDTTNDKKTEKITGAFKSSRVINGHSMEFIGKNVLDVRILHRFGLLKDGIGELFGLDQASMRLGFDYGLSKDFTIGVGRSTLGKELDGFLKYRLAHQSTGHHSIPVTIVLITGSTLTTSKFPGTAKHTETKHRIGYYSQIIIGRKFSNAFSLQLSPTYVHRNLVPTTKDDNDSYALGIGSRLKLSKRVALVADYQYILAGINKDIYHNPLSIGFDIETGGHVFQLHFSNATGMNEKAFITNTPYSWGSGEVRFGFNLSRVFTLGKRKTTSETAL